MKKAKQTITASSSGDIQRLVDRAARQGLTLDPASAKSLASLGPLAAVRELEGACRLIKAARGEDVYFGFRAALRRLETCGGNPEEAIRRMLAGGAEAIEGVCETAQYAADRGVVLAPRSIYYLLRERGDSGTRRYIDKVAAIMDAASIFGVDCSQARAAKSLSRADGDAQHVIAGFAAEHRRRTDRQRVTCRVPIPPRALDARSNAFAGCGCPRCRERLAAHMQRYISTIIARPFCNGLDREDARAEANLELIRSAETWPGGSFSGWFANGFEKRVKAIYASRASEARDMLSLDAPGVLSEDDGGRTVPLGERIPDRSVDVLTIVLLRERVAEAALELRQTRADRSEEFVNCSPAGPHAAPSPRRPRLVPPQAPMTEAERTVDRTGLNRKAA
jgi:hypothetical protein